MFFIYSVELETYRVVLYDFSKTIDGVDDLLDNVAINFIRSEHGNKRAENPFFENESEVTQEGYHLRRSQDKQHQIDVYKRTTLISSNWTWGSTVTTDFKRKMFFSVTEASIGMPTEVTGRSISKPKFENEKVAAQHGALLGQLSGRLVDQRKKIEKQIEEDCSKEPAMQQAEIIVVDDPVPQQAQLCFVPEPVPQCAIVTEPVPQSVTEPLISFEIEEEKPYVIDYSNSDDETDEEELENPIVRTRRLICPEPNRLSNIPFPPALPQPLMPLSPPPPLPNSFISGGAGDVSENIFSSEDSIEEYSTDDESYTTEETTSFETTSDESTSDESTTEETTSDESNNNASKACMALFYWPGVSGCTELLPIWEKFTEDWNNYCDIEIITVNCLERLDIAAKHLLVAYPVIKYCPEGIDYPHSASIFKGKRTVDNLLEFMSQEHCNYQLNFGRECSKFP